jgi:hypothetical protein
MNTLNKNGYPTHVSGLKTVQGLQRYGDSKLDGAVLLAKGWAVHGNSHELMASALLLFLDMCI